MNFEILSEKVTDWAKARQIIPNSNPMAQAIKTTEEVAELLKALSKKDIKEAEDAYGDILVTLVIGTSLANLNLIKCFNTAYEVIKDRQGYLSSDGIFVKEK